MSKPVDLEKLRSINVGGRFKGKAKETALKGEDGSAVGKQVEYGDGRVEVVVRPATVTSKVSLRDG